MCIGDIIFNGEPGFGGNLSSIRKTFLYFILVRTMMKGKPELNLIF